MKTLGDILLEKLTTHQLFRVSHPDPDEPHVFTWQANSEEQLEGIFREAQKEYWEERREGMLNTTISLRDRVELTVIRFITLSGISPNCFYFGQAEWRDMMYEFSRIQDIYKSQDLRKNPKYRGLPVIEVMKPTHLSAGIYDGPRL